VIEGRESNVSMEDIVRDSLPFINIESGLIVRSSKSTQVYLVPTTTVALVNERPAASDIFITKVAMQITAYDRVSLRFAFNLTRVQYTPQIQKGV
jgi:hypothetical protein